MSVLDGCASPAHRAVLRLTGVALGGQVSPALLDDLDQSDPLKIAEIANVELVHCLLSAAQGRSADLDAAIPADLWLYFREMTAANAERLARGRAQLVHMGRIFSDAGIAGVVLKGGANLLAPLSDHAEWRFVSDLDVLLSADAAQTAHDLLVAEGADFTPFEDLIAQEMHHLPGLDLGPGTFPVEIHTRTGADPLGALLPAEALVQRAVPTDIAGLLVPALADRHLHHVLHSALERYDRFEFLLRGLIDQQVFGDLANGRDAREAAIRDAGAAAPDAALTGLLDLTRGREDSPAVFAAKPWLTKALRRFGQPGARRRVDLWLRAKTLATRLTTSAAYRKHYWQVLRDGEAIGMRLSLLRDRIGRKR